MADSPLTADDEQDLAFVESVAGINQKIEALKRVFPAGKKHQALDAMQMATVALTAAAVAETAAVPSD